MSAPPVGRGTVATLLVLSSMTVMAGSTISPTLPAIERVFSGSPRSELLVRLVLTLPALFTAIGAPIAGQVIDRFGRRPLLYGAVLLYALAGGSGLVARTLPELLLGRAGLGLAIGGVLTTATTLIADYFHGEARSRVLGWQSAFMGIGGVAFVTLGGFLTDLSWRAPFGVYLLALAYLPLVALFLPEPGSGQNAGPRGAAEPGAVAPAAAGPSPSADAGPSFVHRPVLALVYFLAFLGMILFFALPVQLPFHLEALGTTAAARIGLALATMTGTAVVTSLLYARIKQRVSFPAVFVLLYALQGLGYLALGAAPSYAAALPGLVIAGAGAGLFVPNVQLWASHLAPAERRGRILGGLGLCLFLGQFLSPLITQPIAEARGYGGMYAALAVFQLGAGAIFLVGTTLRRRGRR